MCTKYISFLTKHSGFTHLLPLRKTPILFEALFSAWCLYVVSMLYITRGLLTTNTEFSPINALNVYLILEVFR